MGGRPPLERAPSRWSAPAAQLGQAGPRAPPERLVVPGVDAHLMLAVGPGMGGDEGALMIDLDRPLRAPVDLDGPPDVGWWHRITIGLHRHQTIGRDLPAQDGGEAVRRVAVMGPQLFLQKRLCRFAKDGTMETLIRHHQHPFLGHGVQAVPTGKLPPHHETALDVLDARFHLTLRLRPIGPT